MRQVMDCNSDGFQCLLGYWRVHAIDYWQGANVKCSRRRYTVYRVMTRAGWKKCNRSSRECMVSLFEAMHSVFSGMGM